MNLFHDERSGSTEYLVDEIIGGADLDWLLLDFTHDDDDATATEQSYVVDLSPFPRT